MNYGVRYFLRMECSFQLIWCCFSPSSTELAMALVPIWQFMKVLMVSALTSPSFRAMLLPTSLDTVRMSPFCCDILLVNASFRQRRGIWRPNRIRPLCERSNCKSAVKVDIFLPLNCFLNIDQTPIRWWIVVCVRKTDLCSYPNEDGQRIYAIRCWKAMAEGTFHDILDWSVNSNARHRTIIVGALRPSNRCSITTSVRSNGSAVKLNVESVSQALSAT